MQIMLDLLKALTYCKLSWDSFNRLLEKMKNPENHSTSSENSLPSKEEKLNPESELKLTQPIGDLSNITQDSRELLGDPNPTPNAVTEE